MKACNFGNSDLNAAHASIHNIEGEHTPNILQYLLVKYLFLNINHKFILYINADKKHNLQRTSKEAHWNELSAIHLFLT